MKKQELLNDLKEHVVNNAIDEQLCSGNNKFLTPVQIKEKTTRIVEEAITALSKIFINGYQILQATYIEKKRGLSKEEASKFRISFLEIENLFQQGTEDQKEWEISEDSLKNILSISLETACLSNNLVLDLLEMKKYEEASTSLYFLLNIIPDFQPLLLNLGFSEYQLGRLESATRAYSAAFILEPTNPSPLFHAALCLTENGNNKEAIDYIEKALELSEGDESFNNLRKSAEELRLQIERKVA
jgi:tetratricopeptide (TPR) repeat protein